MKKYTLVHQLLAWSVHLFTATGVIFAFLAILAISEHDYSTAFIWLLIGQFVDGIDGTFARAVNVKEVLPNFSGESIDHVIDFLSYAVIPAYFIYEAELLPPSLALLGVSFILLTSCYYYGKSTYVTKDLHFEGFPVLWNFVAFYMYFIFEGVPLANFIAVVILSILHFLPYKYLYPSQTKEHRLLTLIIFGGATLVFLWVLLNFPVKVFWVKIVAYISIVYFFGMMIYKTFFWKSWVEE